jgi:hypothetical protein
VWISGESVTYQIQGVAQVIGKTWEYSVSIFHLLFTMKLSVIL